MRVLAHTGGIVSTNCFLVIDDESKKCVLFDAPDHTVDPVLDFVEKEKLELIGLWLTHGHFDHIADHKVVSDRFPNVKKLIHPLDELKLTRPGSAVFQLPFVIPPGKADELISEGERLLIGQLAVEVMHTPGHSPGHVSFYIPSESLLIGGDLIIAGSIGRTDLPDSNHAHLVASIKRVMALPGETRLLSGHGEPSTLEDERNGNMDVRRILMR